MKKFRDGVFVLLKWVLVMLWFILMLEGCASPPPVFPPVDPPLIWPQSGKQPRYAYVGSLYGESDLKRPRSFWNWLGDLWGGVEPPSMIRRASDVAVTSEKVLYVADPGARLVHRFDIESREYRALTDAGDGRRFITPIGIAVMDEELVVADRSLQSVTVFSPSGEPRLVIGREVLKGPVGISIGPLTGRIYVADVSHHSVIVFESDGSVAQIIGGRGENPGKFNFPTHLAFDREENLYITDTLNCRVQVFDREGRFLRIWGRRGNRPGEFSQPKGIACDQNGRIYVLDSHFENVQIFTPNGELLLVFGEEGNGPGQFWLPVGIFIDEDDSIWIGDSFNQRVQVFRYIGDDSAKELP